MGILGMPALIELNTVEEHVALCARLGLNFVELNTNFPNQQLHLLDPKHLRTLAEKHGIGYTIHLNDEMPVADFNPTVAKGYCDAVLEAISFADAIGASVINMHISEGAHYTRPDGIVYFYEAYREAYLDRMAAFRDLCEKAIGSRKIHICVENSKAFFDFQKAALALLLESPAFALTLDVGHNHCSNYADEQWFLAHKDRLRHIHLHDALGKQDHLPLGEGQIDLARYIRLAGEQDLSILLEVKTAEGLCKSVPAIREAIYEL